MENKKGNLDEFIGMLSDEEAEKKKKEIQDFRSQKYNFLKECQHNWIWYPDETSTYKWTGYWKCNKCGLLKFQPLKNLTMKNKKEL